MPAVTDLPLPSRELTGWPWTEGSEPVPPHRPDGSPWPRITIVTPSYNQGQYIEETIRSILLQGYPNLEYIIMDGGSTDGTVDIIRKYERWIDYWESVPDQGQAHAINKGLARATGALFQWINSDDVLQPGSLLSVAQARQEHCAVAGRVLHNDGTRTFVNSNALLAPQNILAALSPFKNRPKREYLCDQPGIFLDTTSLRDAGGIDDTLHYIFDLEMFVRYFDRAPNVIYVPHALVQFRYHAGSKSVGANERFYQEYPQLLQAISQANVSDPIKRQAKRIQRLYNLSDQFEAHEKLPATYSGPLRELASSLRLMFLYREIRSVRFFIGRLRRRILDISR
jgi:glycosyltransferase involved in cell wall biosynthesis